MEGMEGKLITMFYDDGGNISRKDGTYLNEKNGWVSIRLEGGKVIVIDRARIIRLEVR